MHLFSLNELCPKRFFHILCVKSTPAWKSTPTCYWRYWLISSMSFPNMCSLQSTLQHIQKMYFCKMPWYLRWGLDCDLKSKRHQLLLKDSQTDAPELPSPPYPWTLGLLGLLSTKGQLYNITRDSLVWKSIWNVDSCGCGTCVCWHMCGWLAALWVPGDKLTSWVSWKIDRLWSIYLIFIFYHVPLHPFFLLKNRRLRQMSQGKL